MKSFFLLLLLAPVLLAQEIDRPRERSEWFFQQRAYPHGYLRAGDRLKALREAERMRNGAVRSLAASPTQWTLIGPQPTSPQPGSTSGRVTALAVDPRDPNVVYLGAAEGGVWKTTDGGLHWTSLSDALPTLATGSIALDPVNPNIVYVGTGEENNCGDCYFGAGILKSTDGGATWTQLPGPFIDSVGRGARIGSLAVHPTNGQILLAAVNFVGGSGIYRSTDAAASWTLVQRGNAGATVLFDPTDPNIAYGTLYATGVYKSVNAGVTWTLSNGAGTSVLPASDASRIEIALAPSSPRTLYAGLAALAPSAGGSLLGFFKSVDGGQNWNPLPNTPDYCRAQCVYNNVLGVDPTNPNVVYAGGISLYRTLDGGANWTPVSSGAGSVTIHVDQHALAFAGGSKLYAGNDGGVYSVPDRGAPLLTWSNLNDTLSITEFYPAISIHPADVNTTFAGTQDNGTQRYSGNLLWDRVTCGDGGWTIIDSAQPTTAYGTCQRIDIRKSVNNGNSWTQQIRGLDTTDRGAFIPPFVADPSNSQRLYFGTFRLYQSNDGAGSWVPISPDLAGGSFVLTTIAVARGDPDTAYVGTSGGRVQVTTNLGAGLAATWRDRTAGLPVRSVTRVVADATSSATAYVTFSGFSGVNTLDTQGHVFKTANGGANWADISANLPNIPVSDIIIDPDLANTYYVATDAGVFRSSNGGASWSPLGTGMPRVVVMGLALHRPSRTLRAATHGRSMWDIQVPLDAGSNPAPGLSSISPASADPGVSVALTVNGMGFVPGSVVRWKGPGNLSSNRPTTFVSVTQLTASLSAAELAVAGIAQVTVFNPGPGGGTSNGINFTVAALPAVTSGGTVNAASFGNLPPAAGSIVSTFGSNLAFSSAAAGALPLPLALEGVVIRYNSTAAPLFFVSPLQINHQIPWELAVLAQASLAVSAGAVNGNSQVVRLANFGPGIFTTTQTGSGQGAILIASTGSPAAPAGALPGARPVTRGESISIFATGLGAVTNRPASGSPALADPLSTTTTTPVVTIGGFPAPISFSGLAPGLVGVYQVNAQVPGGAPTGNAVPLVLAIAGVSSNTVTLAVQ